MVVWQMLGPLNAILVGAVYGLLLLAILHRAYTFNVSTILKNYRRLIGIDAATSFGILGFVGVHLFRLL